MAPNRGALVAQNDMTKRLGETFRRVREAAGVTLRPLAAELDIAVRCIRRHEAGAMMLRTDKLVKAAAALRVEPADLLEVEDDRD